MAHFAQIDENNIVLQVIVINNSDCLDESNNESEAVGALYCHNLLGGIWKQTSYNHSMRKNYACIGGEYREDLDAFIHPKPYASWVLNETTCKWEAPVAYPADGWVEGIDVQHILRNEDRETGFDYDWNEENKNWTRV
jgi:hypothetical protein